LRQTEGSGVCHLAKAIEADLRERKTGLQKPHIPALADLAACALTTRSVNSCEWIVQLPRKECNREAKERYIMRFLANAMVCPLQVMGGFVSEVLEKLSQRGETIVLMLDQSKLADGLECLMVSLRFGERALPVAWRVIETKGEIGFGIQKVLLEGTYSMMSQWVSILLSADRFYGRRTLHGRSGGFRHESSEGYSSGQNYDEYRHYSRSRTSGTVDYRHGYRTQSGTNS
jgi:hypothetical protein